MVETLDGDRHLFDYRDRGLPLCLSNFLPATEDLDRDAICCGREGRRSPPASQ